MFLHPLRTHPLSSPQLDIYYDQLLKGDIPTYNIGGYIEFPGYLDIDAFERALNLVVKMHDSFRILLVESEDGIPRQYIAEEISIKLACQDFSGRAAPRDDARAWINQDINIPFALIGRELFRSALIKLNEGHFYWYICVHHLIADGWAIDKIFQSLANIYSALIRREVPDLTAPSYLGFLEADKHYLRSLQFQKDRAYWLEKYSQVPEPLLSPRHQELFMHQTAASGECKWKLPRALNEKINALAIEHSSTRFQIIFALFYAFFLRLEQRDKFTIGLSVLNRKNAEFKRTSGLFSNVIPVRLQFSKGKTLVELLSATASMLRQDYRHQRFPIGELNKDLELFKNHRSQLYDLSISYEHGGGALLFGSTSAVAVKCTNDYESTPLRLNIRDNLDSKDATMCFIFSRSYFNDDEIERLKDRFTCFTEELLSNPSSPIESVPIVTPEEMQEFRSWNSTKIAFPDDKCVHELFELQAEQRPDAVAVVQGGESLTYSELNAQANRVARHLILLGVRPDDRIALCVERSVAMIVGLLAILKAGAAYVPLDPAYPSERLAYVLEDAQPVLLLTDASGRLALSARSAALTTLDLDEATPDWGSLSTQNPQIFGLSSSHLAYVIYTSGSTGQPKGVMVEHRNVCHQVAALQRAYSLNCQDRLLQFASIAFDMSVEEIFPALLTGAMLVLRTDQCLNSPSDFARFCAAHRLTSLNLPSTFWAQLALAQPEPEFPSTLRQVISGGDAISPSAVATWLRRIGHRPRLFNAYGPTESTVNATLLEVVEAPHVSSIGRPISNTQIYLLDASGQPVPVGSIGELHIGGAGVARGYFNRPQLTAERFLADPFSSIPGARMYRTGDLARYLVDGSLEFLGRNDNQVKIRGFRIELGEIENRLMGHPAVREAVVLAAGEGSDKRLVAYLVAEAEVADESSLVTACRDYLSAELPDYMVPAAFVRLDALPLTTNGKLDRKALPDPDSHAFAHRAYEPPQGPVEIALAALWQELLGVERIGRHDHFFELGGHSLIAMRLLGKVGQQFDSALSLISLFSHPTLAGLAAVIDLYRKDGKRSRALPPILPVVHTETVPLSYAQQRLWFLAQLDSVSTTYHISLVLHLNGALDSFVLRRSLDRLLARHEALRTVFHPIDGHPCATLLPVSTPFALTEYDLRSTLDADTLLARHTDEYAHAPFDLEHGPLIRAGLVRLADRRYTLLLSLHHIVADGWSINLLALEISALYTAFLQQLPDPLPLLPVQYPDYASWQHSALTPERLQSQADYWQHALEGAPELLNLPTDRPRPPHQSFAGAMIPVRVDPSLTRKLKDLCTRHGVSLFMLFTTAWANVLARLSGQDDVLIGTLSANRGHREIESLIGFFVSTLILRLDMSGNPDTADMLRRVRRTILAAQENQDLPFEQVVEKARPTRRLDYSPLFQVLFAWQSNDKSTFDLPGVDVSQAEISFTSIRYDLELHLFEKDDAVVGLLGYSTALFDESSITRHCGYLMTMLEAMVASPGLRLKQVPLVGASEQALLDRWNDTSAVYPQDSCIHRLFEQQAECSPQAIALIYGEQQLSYAELNAWANQWALHLRGLGIGVDQRVALCTERSFEMVIGLLAILKAGASYVPLDPSYPSERLLQILDEAEAQLVLSDAAGRAALGAKASAQHRMLDLNTLAELCAELPKDGSDALSQEPTPDDLAYVIYTSGSTGKPKGVAMPHRPLVNLIHWQQQQAERSGTPAPRTLQYAALGFDVAFQEVFTSLCGGASLVLIDSETRLRFDKLIEILRMQRVQRVFLPYIALQTLAETVDDIPADGCLLPDLREIIVAGEQLRLTPQIQRLFQRLPACHLHNHYGPTETHVVTAQILTPEAIIDSPNHVPIGFPIANSRAYLLDQHGLPVPLGAVGELHIGGVGIARGYLGRAELTAERFLADPFHPRPGARMYRTGDLARYLPDGRLVCLGRNDHQVKVRGFRIELGEIEARLAEHPMVRECVVIARKDARADLQLVAYVVPLGGSDGLATALHEHLGSLLPPYMVPSAFMALDTIPFTAHGKLDHKALPSPDEQAFAHSTYEPPRGEIEVELARLWQTLLGVSRVGRHDHFFELGGHSLLAVRLISRVTQVFGIGLPLATLFAQPVLHAFAQMLAERLTEVSDSTQEAITPSPRGKHLPLSHAQQRLWFLAQLDEASATYHIPLALHLDGVLDVDALRHALDRLFARHESLRTVFVVEHGQPHAELLPANSGLALREYDLSGLPDTEIAQAQCLAEERNRPFDLAAGPMIRASLVRLDERRHVLLLTLHHIVADGWSLGILARELGAYYAASNWPDSDPLPPMPIQYADYAAWERKWLTGERLEDHAAYWRSHMAGAPTLLELPTDRPHPIRQSFAGAFLPLTLDRELTRDLKRLGQQHGVTLFMIVLAAWATVLSRLAGQQEVLIGTPTAGRGRQELESLIGFFVNTLALRINLSAPLNTASLLAQVRQVSLDAQAHQELPFEQVVEILGVPRRIDRTPLVQVLFAWQSNYLGELEIPGILVEPVSSEFDWVKFDLELILNEVDGVIHGGFNYASALFDHETIVRHAGYLKNMLEGMVAGDSRSINEISMLSAAEQQMLLETWNLTETPYPDQLCIHQLVEHWASKSPQAIALAWEERRLSYAELNAQANRLAHYLIRLGVQPGQHIALCTAKGVAMFVGLLGILKAGGAYVPLDPAYASSRLDLIVRDATPHLLLCDDAGRAALSSSGVAMPNMLDVSNDALWDNCPMSNPEVAELSSRHLAYIIYTSGSTGIPKGVMVEHHGIINLAQSLSDIFGVTAHSRVSQFASLSFDASVLESVIAFVSGAALYLPSGAERESPSSFIEFVDRHRITHATLPPAFLQSYVEAPHWTHRPSLILAGEAPGPSLVKTWMHHARIFNAYGPTEISVCASVWVCPTEPGELLAVPIGRPIANTRLYLLDEHGQPVPRGSIGELYIGGIGVTRGYLNKPELTAERFLRDPFDTRLGARMYRSGDLARYLPDGNLVFVGRNDHQVKLRGFRIELGEIEAHLAMHPAVRESVVLAREDRSGDPRLVAYVVAHHIQDDIQDDLVATLRDYLRLCLPEYMVPAAFVSLDSLPLMVNGKLDRKALPAPDDEAFSRRTYTPPSGETEAALATVWRELLGVERIGRHDHFFELGGHSLMAAQLAARIREIFETPVAIRDLFLYPVLKDMANLAFLASEPDRSPTLDLNAELVLDEDIYTAQPARYCVRPEHILLTGASGFLGAFLLSSLLKRTQATIHCLIRCANPTEGLFRLDANMRLLGLAEYERGRIVVIPGDLAQPLLGLSEDRFDELAGLIEVIYHNGAWVNSLHNYASLKAANVLGTQEILRLAGKYTPKHIHYISTLSTIPPIESAGLEITTETQLAEHWVGLASGYAQSKWVAERLLRIGGERGIPFTVYRPTHIGGSSTSGASNADDTWSLFVDACLILERIPEFETTINSLPVDYMSDCIVELSLREGMHGKSINLANPLPFMLSELTAQIAMVEGLTVEYVNYREWQRLCSEDPTTSRLALVMPDHLSSPLPDQTEVRRVDISNAVVELSREGMPYSSISTTDLLQKYVTWRYRRLGHVNLVGHTNAV